MMSPVFALLVCLILVCNCGLLLSLALKMKVVKGDSNNVLNSRSRLFSTALPSELEEEESIVSACIHTMLCLSFQSFCVSLDAALANLHRNALANMLRKVVMVQVCVSLLPFSLLIYTVFILFILLYCLRYRKNSRWNRYGAVILMVAHKGLSTLSFVFRSRLCIQERRSNS